MPKACAFDCTPDCSEASCGSDGCGGSCGICTHGKLCVDGAWAICTVENYTALAAVYEAGVELTCDYREFDTTADIMMASISPLGRQLPADFLMAMEMAKPAN